MKKLYLILIATILLTSSLFAAPISSNAVTGNWGTPGTWVGGIVPGAGDDVTIVNGAVISVTTNSSALTVTIGGGTSGKLLLATAGVSLTTFGTLSVSSGATLQVDNGTLNIGNLNGHRLDYTSGSIIIINGGAINLASRMTSATTFGINYTQTGGIFTVNTVENQSTLFASFDIRSADNSSFTMSGGSIVIQNAADGGSGPRDYNNNAVTKNITGGTVQIGNGGSGIAKTFFLQGDAPNLVIDNTSAGHTARLLGNLIVKFSTTINTTNTLRLDADGITGHTLTQLGTTLLNNGTLDGTVAGSILEFHGTVPQSYTGSGSLVSPLARLSVNFGGGLTLGTPTSNFIVSILDMSFGDITTGSNTLVLGTSPTATGTLNFVVNSGKIIGKFKRWVAATTGNTYFPVGVLATIRDANINFTTAPATGGSLTTEWVSSSGGSNGLPLTESGVPPITNTSINGFWRVTAADGLTGGIYTGTFTANLISSVTDFSTLVLVKRANTASPWTLSGTHVTTTGSNTSAVLSRTGFSGFSEFGIGGNATTNVLPLTIEYIKGIKLATGNLLNWKVDCTNSLSARMTLERSADRRNFKGINVINATALQCQQPFSYTDAVPLSGINYYRLKYTDADGLTKYSNTIAILNKDKGIEFVSLMPNPVKTVSTLNIASATASKMDIRVIDITGKQLSKQTVSLIAGSNLIPLNFENLVTGTYEVVCYSEDGQIKSLRFVKQ